MIFAAAGDNGGANTGWVPMGTVRVSPVTPTYPAVTSVSPASGDSATATITAIYTDSTSGSNLGPVDLLINNAINGVGACYVAYSAGTVYLVDNAGDTGGPFAGTFTIPSTATIQNSQCSVSGSGTTATVSGTTLTFTVNVTFFPSFGGLRTFYQSAQTTSGGGGNSGWHAFGAWAVPGPISGTAVLPETISESAFTPFGEKYLQYGSATPDYFAGMLAVADAGTISDGYQALARLQESNSGRWVSPDPAGLGAVDMTNPQSWNRYVYVANNPLSATDPSGLYLIRQGALCYWAIDYGVDGDYQGTDLYPVNCPATSNVSDGNGGGGGGGSGGGGTDWKRIGTCLAKGVVVGAVGAVAVGAVAVGAVALGAPVGIVTGALVVASAVGFGVTGWNVGTDLYTQNSAGLAYDLGSFVGGLAGGVAGAKLTWTGTNPGSKWPGWSDLANEGKKLYDPNYPGGSVAKWMSTGPTVGYAAAGPAVSQGLLASLLGGC